MRLKAEECSTQRKFFNVYVDGVRINRPVEADTDEGWVRDGHEDEGESKIVCGTVTLVPLDPNTFCETN